ncbi:MAG: ferredoxin family protein [Desulfovibrionaceae bacterium]|jgi:2-oxoglutarate ferredoxin oxidoreductase subunit delta
MVKKQKGQTSVLIYPDWCKGCGICAAFCPAKVIEIKDGKACVIRENECVNCGFCELHCPDFAIVVRPKESGEGQTWEPGGPSAAAARDPRGARS